MKVVYILFFATLLTNCNRFDKKISENKSSNLKLQVDSLKQLNENLKTTNSFLFDKALNLEKSDKEAAIKIYKTITDTKNGDFWSVESEKRILQLTKSESKNRDIKFTPNEDFYWLFGDTLELSQENEKCGEWGGDVERIRIFWKNRKLIGYYVRESYNCDSLEREYIYGKVSPTKVKSKEIELTTLQVELLKMTIVNLTNYQLNNLEFYGNSGIVNIVQIQGKDGSFKKIHIQDYPSFNWNLFHKMKSEILKNRR